MEQESFASKRKLSDVDEIDSDEENKCLINRFPPFGFGPWYVALAFNIAKNPKKKTLIIVHSSPEWHLQIRNFGEAGDAYWRCAVFVGPFEADRHATTFKELWEKGPRPMKERLLRGIVMCHVYNKTYGTNVWFRESDQLKLSNKEIEELVAEKEKRQRIRRGRRGKSGERVQRIYELMPQVEREITLGATRVKREIREARKK